jgi:hypothetical protein
MFSSHASKYMVDYHALDNHKDDKTKNSDEKDGMQINPLMTAYLI